uniref:Uncharacterized protein n=1 Tax=Setaria italica TaxID=4555 RepID=K4AP01_SETIT
MNLSKAWSMVARSEVPLAWKSEHGEGKKKGDIFLSHFVRLPGC